jgi:hypothetical protein
LTILSASKQYQVTIVNFLIFTTKDLHLRYLLPYPYKGYIWAHQYCSTCTSSNVQLARCTLSITFDLFHLALIFKDNIQHRIQRNSIGLSVHQTNLTDLPIYDQLIQFYQSPELQLKRQKFLSSSLTNQILNPVVNPNRFAAIFDLSDMTEMDIETPTDLPDQTSTTQVDLSPVIKPA